MRTPERDPLEPALPRYAPRPGLAAAVASIVLAVLLANGRPIPAGDTRPTERIAASLVQEGDLDLDEHPEIEPPFARQVGPHRVSIYPALSGVLAAPVFAAARFLFDLDEAGCALAGKLSASLFSALAAALFFLAVGRRHGEAAALGPTFVFALGTSVWSTSQALWQHPAALLFVSMAVLFVLWAEQDPSWAGRAGLPLSLAVAARHADVAIALVLAAGIALRWPRRVAALVLWALPGAAFVLAYQGHYFGSPLRHGFSGTLGRFSEPWGAGQLGLLASPGKGLLVFTPVVLVALVGLVRATRRGERALGATLGLAFVAHLVLTGRWTEWHGGVCFGPRLMTDALPLLLVFLPDGIAVMRRAAWALAAVSVGVQALGAFSYDTRWERLYQHPPDPEHHELWSWTDSPIAFQARERVVRLAAPAVIERRVVMREHPLVLFAEDGSRVSFQAGRPLVEGAAANLTDVHLQRGARVEAGTLRLQGRWDALFLRVTSEARRRPLELRAVGRGSGTLYVGEASFWSPTPRWRAYPMDGAFRIVHRYEYATSGGGDLLVSLGKGGGEASLARVALLSPGDPDDVQPPR